MTIYTDVFGNSTLPPAEYGFREVTITANTTFVWPYNTNDSTTAIAKIMDFTCNAGNVLTLPDATEVSTGEDFLIRNVGANDLTVNDAGGTPVYTVVAGAAVYFYLTDNSTSAGSYGTIAYGVGTSSVDAATLVGYGIKAISGTLNQSHPVVNESTTITIGDTYRAKLINYNGGAVTANLDDATTLGDDFFFMLRNSGSGSVTIDPNGSQTIDGQSTMVVQPGESLMLFCNGAAWFSVGYGRSTLFQFTQLVLDVSVGGTFTLTSSEAANKLLTFIGNPVAGVTVVVPSIVSVYYTYNNLSTAQSVTIETALGAGVGVAQGARAILLCDGVDVISAQSISAGSSLSLIDGTAAAPALNFSSQTNTGLYKYGANGVGLSSNGTDVFHVDAASGPVFATPLPVTSGGTGRATSTTAYGLLAAGTTATGVQQTLPAGATTEILVGGGAAALPVWTIATGSGAPVRATAPTISNPTVSTGTFTNPAISTGTLTSVSLVTSALGTPTSGNLSSCTADGTNAVGPISIPQNSRSAAYTLVITDAGKHIFHPSADTTARTWTIPANASVAFAIGTAVTFINQNGAGVISIAITSDTMRLAGTGVTGTRSLAANGVATAVKVTATEWIISGTGLT